MIPKNDSPIDAAKYLHRATSFAGVVGACMLIAALYGPVRHALALDNRVAALIGAAGALVLLVTAGTNVVVWASRDRGKVGASRPIAVIEESDVPAYQQRLLADLRKISSSKLAALYVLDGGSAEDLADMPAEERVQTVYHHLLANAGSGLKLREQLQSLVTLIESSL